MSPSQARKDWRAFKTRHKEFVQQRDAKAKLGPAFDKLDKATKNLGKAEQIVDKAVDSYEAAAAELGKALKAYQKVVDATRKADLIEDYKDFSGYVDKLPGMVEELRANRRRMWSDLEDQGWGFAQ